MVTRLCGTAGREADLREDCCSATRDGRLKEMRGVLRWGSSRLRRSRSNGCVGRLPSALEGRGHDEAVETKRLAGMGVLI